MSRCVPYWVAITFSPRQPNSSEAAIPVGGRIREMPDKRKKRPARFRAGLTCKELVSGGGLEPPRVAPYAPQTYASASSAMTAYRARPILYILVWIMSNEFSGDILIPDIGNM